MKWLSNLLTRTKARPPVLPRPATTQVATPVEDVEQLRGALARALDGERIQMADRLGRALAGRAQAPQADDPSEVWVAAVCHAPDKALALTWVAKLNGDTWLGEVVSQARISEVRFAAARRIEATGALEQVAQASRDKDKRVYRHCSDLLRQRRQVEASARRVKEIADELRNLLDTAPLPATRLLDLKKELSALSDAGEPYLECDALMRRAIAQLQQESEARRDLQLSQCAAVTLLEECANAAWPWSERADAWRARLDTLIQTRDGLPSWLAEQATARALAESLSEIASHLAKLATEEELVLACDQFLTALEADLQPTAESAAAWDALAKPDHPDARPPLESRWQALSAHLRAHLPPPVVDEPAPSNPSPAPQPRPKRQIDQDAVRELLDKLEQAIAEGHLLDADAAAKQIKTTLGGNNPRGALESRLHSLHAQLEALRGWARWGTGQARDQLIAAAEGLLNGEQEVEELATAIAALREEWKRLNAHGAAAKGQWESFDQTLEKAYQPVAARRAEDALRQAEARAAREALCAGWEAEMRGMDWEHADFKAVEARRAEMLKQWHAAPKTGFRDERALRKQFDPMIASIDQHLAATRAGESERRERIIATAQALSELPDLRRAMSEAKSLQSQWNPQGTVRLKRSDEEKLWRRFRAACDSVFQRQDAQREEQAIQHQEWLRSRETLLDAFAAALSDADASAVKQVLAQFNADWGIGKPTPRDHADSLEDRARGLRERAQQRLAEVRNEKLRAGFDLLARKAVLAEGVEAAALAAGPLETAVAEAKQAWDELPPLPGNSETLLAQRLAAAVNATPTVLATGRAVRETMLLDLEIALGLPSPKEYAVARHERQLERLQNRFGAASAQPREPETLLSHWYATAALPDAAFDRRIEAIMLKLVERDSTG